MIRRISANNDYRDIIRSCPSGVIDDIYAIEYYVKGYDGLYSAAFSKTGSLLEVIIPSSALKTLHSGVLMRRAKYRNADTSFPDQYYDLEFVEDMNVWLENGSEPGPGPEPGEYVTEEELAETLEGYVTDEEFSGAVEDINNNMQLLDDRVTVLEQGGVGGGSWGSITGNIQDQQDLMNEFAHDRGRLDDLETGTVVPQGTATESWVENQNYASDTDLDALDARVSVLEHGGSPSSVSWGGIAGTITDQSDLMHEFDADRSRLDDLENSGFATEQWVDNKLMTDGYLTEYTADQRYPTFSWIESSGYAMESWVSEQGYAVEDQNDPFITESVLTDVLAGNDNRVLREDDLGPYAQMSWVQGQGYITSSALSGYATQSWVQNQGYLDSNSTLPADQITCNISGDVFDFDDVDEGLTALVSKVEENIGDISSLDTRVTALEQSGGGGGIWGSITGTISDQTDLMNLLSGYATQTWVGQQGYITSSALNGYATQQWATNQFLEENKVWAGTAAQWANLTAEEKASYKIALVTA